MDGERFFFHDLVNLTHGVRLFLERHDQLDAVQVRALREEIRTLQDLIQDHYRQKHRDLGENQGAVPFDVLKIAVKRLAGQFLRTEVEWVFKGVEEIEVHYPVWYRIMNNLIKNIGEAGARQVKISFNGGPRGLSACLQNATKRTDCRPNLGLRSIKALCRRRGGVFQYFIREGVWVSEVFLPNSKEEAA